MSHAIIQTGGKQYRVAVGDTLEVEKLESKPGDRVNFPVLLLEDEVNPQDTKIGKPILEGVEVTAEVLNQMKGPKLIAYTYRRRKGSERKVGHRQPLTLVKITNITS